MSDFGTMQDRIGRELKRPDLEAEIKDSILSALEFFKRNRLRFNSKRATLKVVPGQEYYQLPSDFIASNTMVLRSGAQELDFVEMRSSHWLDREKEWAGYNSRPAVYAIQNNELRLYPVPDLSYTILMSFVYELPNVSASALDTASNAWMTDGEELIRTHAKVDMLENIIRGPEAFQEASLLRGREAQVFKQLDIEYKRSHSSGRLQPWT
jgi:hypothetical protein